MNARRRWAYASAIERRGLHLLLSAASALAMMGCGADPTTVEAAGPAATATAAAAETGASTRSCPVADGPTGPIFDATLQEAHGATRPDPGSFDWNQDGQTDILRFDPLTASVAVDHGAGTFVVRGVPSDFDDVLYETAGPVEAAGPAGPPSAEAFAQGRAGPTPATIADVTGDGRPDLAVIAHGELTVHTGSARSAAESATVDASGSSPTSWSNPRTDTDLPFDEATVVAVGDIDGDGIGDLRVDSYAPRSFVSSAFYLGKPCDR